MDFLKPFNITIKDNKLLKQALTHSSYSNEHGGDNYERLEFLGDAVLQLITSEYFYQNYNVREGDLSKIRSSFVCEEALATYAKDIGIVEYILVGNGQVSDINDTIIADVFESVLAAIYLDQGFLVAKEYILKIIPKYVQNHYIFLGDYKSRLQEMVQTDKKSLEYKLINETGPSHDKRFEYIVLVDGIIYGKGLGKSKKEAMQSAAHNALEKCARK